MDLSGFQAVVFVRDSAINSVLAGISVDFGSTLRQSATVGPIGIPDLSGNGATVQVSASGTIYLASATAACVDGPNNSVSCQITAYARVALTIDGRSVAAVPLRLSGQIDAPVRLTGAANIFPDPILDLLALSIVQVAASVLDPNIDPQTQALVSQAPSQTR
jgi:hypothetical protein